MIFDACIALFCNFKDTGFLKKKDQKYWAVRRAFKTKALLIVQILVYFLGEGSRNDLLN